MFVKTEVFLWIYIYAIPIAIGFSIVVFYFFTVILLGHGTMNKADLFSLCFKK